MFTIYIKFRKTPNFQRIYSQKQVKPSHRHRILMPIATNRVDSTRLILIQALIHVFCNLFIIDVSFICPFFSVRSSVRNSTAATASPLFIANRQCQKWQFSRVYFVFFSLVRFTFVMMPFGATAYAISAQHSSRRFNEHRRSSIFFFLRLLSFSHRSQPQPALPVQRT